ncbi:Putative uncharacterized protein [Thermobacillus xylanilyticus]|uniref:Uncharacterized protein n=1 Tax=Thermobacillus xylanilyticus TaxID=76633 RepID=A0ABM8V3A4_THEXY|nr:hypothetical protein [Thermobacillus xylanilyticus]REJ14938.1 MAG: hypothetical protein C6W59_09670 [Paenibacillaceae bacterium]CAG5084791.1 Putative uncharacterized protein [Thermobacillus xylanilyticus]
MNRDFIQLRGLEGELKVSQKKREYGLTVSTREIVFHKPHVNYHIKYDDIVSIVPFEPQGRRTRVSVRNSSGSAVEYASQRADTDQYRLYASRVTVHNRSGLAAMGAMQFVLPIPPKLMAVIAEFSGLDRVI